MNINGKEIKLRYTMDGLYLWEQTMGRRFELRTTFDEDAFFYCTVISNNPDLDITWEEFSHWLEHNKAAKREFIDFLTRNSVKEDEFVAEDSDGEKKSSL